jgi:2-polyprenyl-3-methyl-5-hydroxy-6-metoxy-1,4-benzoquinol methylase
MRRFSFGKNWSNFSQKISEHTLEIARRELSLNYMDDFKSKTFLDVGCGSGLFSAAAMQLGARVTCFDYDPESVETTNQVLRKFCNYPDLSYAIRGDVLDNDFIENLGQYDLVYSWGVLHHTGDMYRAFSNVATLVKLGGQLYIAIYNDQGLLSKFWLVVKFCYCQSRIMALAIILLFSPYFFTRAFLRLAFTRRELQRGMSVYHDMTDWLGGYPFEVAKPEQVRNFFTAIGYKLQRERLVGNKLGCNEFIFLREF